MKVNKSPELLRSNSGDHYSDILNWDDEQLQYRHSEHEQVKAIVIPLLKNGLNSVVVVDWYLQGNNEF